MTYKYSVVSFLPDIIAGEDVNIGIELHDMNTMILYKKYTKNIKEINRRYAFGHKGLQKMHELLFSGFDSMPEAIQDKDYLLKKSEEPNSGYKRIFYRSPFAGITEDPEEALERLYEMFVVIDKKKEKKNG